MTTRRLAAILAADVVGFSSMMEKDEEGTASRIRTMRREVVEPTWSAHQGRGRKTLEKSLSVLKPGGTLTCDEPARGTQAIEGGQHRGRSSHVLPECDFWEDRAF
jgi:class 3 adenylate cyclase